VTVISSMNSAGARMKFTVAVAFMTTLTPSWLEEVKPTNAASVL